jgi:hypothetical protein
MTTTNAAGSAATQGQPKRALSVLAMVLVMLVASATPAAAARTSFHGSWEAIDLDGSHMILSASGGESVRVTFIDMYASMCVNAGARAGIGTLRGSGTVTGDTMTVDFDGLRCSDNIVLLPGLSLEFSYDPNTDTLTGSDVTWHRIRTRSL